MTTVVKHNESKRDRSLRRAVAVIITSRPHRVVSNTKELGVVGMWRPVVLGIWAIEWLVSNQGQTERVLLSTG